MISPVFQNRRDAGRKLAKHLWACRPTHDGIVLALPRGGVPVAAEVARALDLPLDVFVVRKLGLPGHPELAMGAIAPNGVRVLNQEIVNAFHLTDEALANVVKQERAEIDRRERVYRFGQLPIDVRQRHVFLVDDGIATGSTILAAATALDHMGADRVVLAAPVIARDTRDWMRAASLEVVSVIAPSEFQSVGQWYVDFNQTPDPEVREILSRCQRRTVETA